MKKIAPLFRLGITALVLSFSFMTSCSADREELDKKIDVKTKSKSDTSNLHSHSVSWKDETLFSSNYEGLELPKEYYKYIEVIIRVHEGSDIDFNTYVYINNVLEIKDKKYTGRNTYVNEKVGSFEDVDAGKETRHMIELDKSESFSVSVTGKMNGAPLRSKDVEVLIYGYY